MWLVSHLAGLLLLLASWQGIGRILARRLGLRDDFLASQVLGLQAAIVLVVSLAAIGRLPAGPWAWGVLAAPGLIAFVVLGPRRPGPRAALAVGGLLALLAPLAFLASTPIVSWDADVYHLSVPRLYLENGGFRPVPFNVYSEWPLATEMLFLWALALGGPALAKLVHWSFLLLLAGAFLAGARTAGERGAGPLTVGLFLLHPVVLFEARVAYVDLAHAFWVTSTFVLLERARRSDRPTPLLVAAGVAAGGLAGTKLLGPLHVLLIAVVGLPALVGRLGPRRALLPMAVPAALLAVPWPIKAGVSTGNPVYPFLGRIFPTPDWSAELADRLALWQASIGAGRDPLDYLLLPLRIFLADGRGYDRFDGELSAAALVLLPLGWLWTGRLPEGPRGTARRALAISALLFVQWAATSQQLRLLLPALALAGFAAALGWSGRLRGLADDAAGSPGAALSESERSRAFAVGVLALLVVAGNASTLAAGWRAALPLATRPIEEIRASGVPPHWAALRDELPPDALLLVLGANGRFHAPVEVLADSFFEASQIADWLADAPAPEQVVRRLRDRRVTHVLLDRRPAPVEWPPALIEALGREDLLERAWSSPDGRYLLWRVRAMAERDAP